MWSWFARHQVDVGTLLDVVQTIYTHRYPGNAFTEAGTFDVYLTAHTASTKVCTVSAAPASVFRTQHRLLVLFYFSQLDPGTTFPYHDVLAEIVLVSQ